MQIVPVIDLMRGVVVRGVAGRREQYRAVQSRLASDATPGAVARAFAHQYSLEEVYVADLDAIAGAAPDASSYRAIQAEMPRLWLDAGIRQVDDAARLCRLDVPLATIVVGLESCPGPESLEQLCAAIGTDRAAFSLDLRDGQPIVDASSWEGWPAERIVEAAVEAGFTRLIVLDLARVGMGQGLSSLSLCRILRRDYPQLHLTSGGGVRHAGDLLQLAEAGCDAALVASALHDGRLTVDDVTRDDRR